MDAPKSFLISNLLQEYRGQRLTPRQLVEHAIRCADLAAPRNVWISRLSREWLLERAAALSQRAVDDLPLYGIPFVIKDNIDLAGVPTSAACAEYSYLPEQSSVVVQKLLDAGAIPLGKTNLDQFATGLVGTRSPYGACLNSFDAAYVSGGSSSGSAVAVATGLASFALGTDTAGSGRVPAAFNNIIGLPRWLLALGRQPRPPAHERRRRRPNRHCRRASRCDGPQNGGNQAQGCPRADGADGGNGWIDGSHQPPAF
jgi:allophanate hydrolase